MLVASFSKGIYFLGKFSQALLTLRFFCQGVDQGFEALLHLSLWLVSSCL